MGGWLRFRNHSLYKGRPLLCHPDRTPISCHAALDKAALPWERRLHLCHLDRSEAQWRDLCVDAPSWICFSTERTPISCHAALETTARAAFSKESRMKIANATNINRKSGVA